MSTPDPLILDPSWQPYRYDAAAGTIVFAHLSREAQRTATFLDHRYSTSPTLSAAVPVSAIPTALVRDQAGPVHFIFHTAFCCSTLLARAFDQPGASMGLKEPGILAWFAAVWAEHRATANTEVALGTALDLLSRPLTPGETQIVKPSNITNNIADKMLELRPQAKAIVVYSTLRDYLLSTARKGQMGRAFNRDFFIPFHATIPLSLQLTPGTLLKLTDLQVSSLVWLMQVRFLDEISRRFGSARVRTLAADSLLAQPAAVLERAGAFFEISLPPGTSWCAVAEGPIFREHAKTPGTPYSAEQQRADLRLAADAHGLEVDSALEWATGLAHQIGAPLTLGDTLLTA